jgi:hypothetical protein
MMFAYLTSAPHAATSPALSRLENELAVAGWQGTAWRDFVETYERVRGDIAAVDAGSECQAGKLGALDDALASQASRLAVRLDGLLDLEAAASNLGKVLLPRQRVKADRYLKAICRDIGSLRWND